MREGEAPAEPLRRKLGRSPALPMVIKALALPRQKPGNQKHPFRFGPCRFGLCVSLDFGR